MTIEVDVGHDGYEEYEGYVRYEGMRRMGGMRGMRGMRVIRGFRGMRRSPPGHPAPDRRELRQRATI